MNTISLCIIAKDEEKNIGGCLASAAGAVDEIIVIDTGSTDRTAHIAREYGAKVQDFLWNNDFSAARNASLEMAAGDWILILNANERLTDDSIGRLRRAVEDDTAEGYFLTIVNYLGTEDWIDTCTDLAFRLFRNKSDYRFRGAVHEQIADVILAKNSQARYHIAADAVIFRYDSPKQHKEEEDQSGRNLDIMAKELSASPENNLLRYYYGVELFQAGQYEQAVSELTATAKALDPHTIYMPKLTRHIVMALYSGQKHLEALEAVEQGLLLYPDYADLYYYGGLISFKIKEYDRSYDFFQKVFMTGEQPAFYAPFSGARGFRSYYYLGKLAEIFCNEEEAIRYYFLAINDNPYFALAFDSIIRILNPRRNPELAKESLEKLFDFCSPQASILAAKCFFNQGAYVLALEYLERGLNGVIDSPETLLWKGICLNQQKRFFEAIRIYDSIDPHCSIAPLVKLNKLIAYWLQGQKVKVRQMAKDLFSLGLSADTGGVVALLQSSMEKRKQHTVALGESGTGLLLDILSRAVDVGEKEKAESLLTGLSEACLKKSACQIGDLFYRYGQYDLAERYLRMALLDGPEQAHVFFLLAEICCNTGKYSEAECLYRQAQALDGKEPKYFVRLMQVHHKIRLQLMAEAMAKYPKIPFFPGSF